MSFHDAPFRCEAVEGEMHTIISNYTWIVVDFPHEAKVINCKWIFRRKLEAYVTLDKYNARLVAKGFKQKKDFYYLDNVCSNRKDYFY